MAQYKSFGSAVAWYDGEDAVIQLLKANFHRVRHWLQISEPYRIGTAYELFMALKPYYKDSEVLHHQILTAEKAWKNKKVKMVTVKHKGCLTNLEAMKMSLACNFGNQLNVEPAYIGDYWLAILGQPVPVVERRFPTRVWS
jgi:hypothetical protein